MQTNQPSNMSQFAGLDVKIQTPDNLAKRVKTPMTFNQLSTMVNALVKSKGLDISSPPTISYRDADEEVIVVEDDLDLEMAYTIATSAMEKRIKFVATPAKSDTVSQAPSTARTEATENVQMQP